MCVCACESRPPPSNMVAISLESLAIELLQCSHSELRCAEIVKYTPMSKTCYKKECKIS